MTVMLRRPSQSHLGRKNAVVFAFLHSQQFGYAFPTIFPWPRFSSKGDFAEEGALLKADKIY